ncbi:PTS sugar transporter subunit IIC [Weissella fangxianensis]|uniref:PTS sugar transporter subunit IIC n=1 Tax=Weissella fangxianensis TaxID=2953879 RepID=UPI002158815D|nr:PTS sugar transporter subunit IIC [Weissella fangxianensis]
MQAQKLSKKEFGSAILNGNASGIIVALIPAALVSQLLAAMPQTEIVKTLTMMVTLAQSALPIIAAFAVGALLKFGTVESASMALATFIASGVVTVHGGQYVMSGSGVILNIMLTTFMASIVTIIFHKLLGQLRAVFEPLAVLVVGGGLGLLTLPVMVAVQDSIGAVVDAATQTAPLIMGILLGIIFAVLIVSPLSSVGIATAIGLTGIGAANTGIVTASLVLAIMSMKENSWGLFIAHFMGSPKIQMANMLSKPKLFIPVIIASAIAGGVSSGLSMSGTPFSAGFGMSGFIGPITALNESAGSGIGLRVSLTFFIVPIAMALIMKYIFIDKLKLVESKDLKLPEV